jgi:hypothetical protein
VCGASHGEVAWLMHDYCNNKCVRACACACRWSWCTGARCTASCACTGPRRSSSGLRAPVGWGGRTLAHTRSQRLALAARITETRTEGGEEDTERRTERGGRREGDGEEEDGEEEDGEEEQRDEDGEALPARAGATLLASRRREGGEGGGGWGERGEPTPGRRPPRMARARGREFAP